MNIFLGLLNCPYLVSFAPSWASHLIQSWSIPASLVFLPLFYDPLIWSLILSFYQALLFDSSVPSYNLSDSFLQLSNTFFFFFFPVISRLFCTPCFFCFLQVCPSITSCSGYMWGSCSQQEANVCTYHNYADFLHFVIDLPLLRSVFILAEQILSRLTQTNWAAMMPFFKPFHSFCFSFFSQYPVLSPFSLPLVPIHPL